MSKGIEEVNKQLQEAYNNEECEIESFSFGSYDPNFKKNNPVVTEQVIDMIEAAFIKAKWTRHESSSEEDCERFFNDSLMTLKSVIVLLETQKG